MNAAANLHAIWLDDLAPGEGSTPLFDALFAEVDDETRAVILRACADEHTEPVSVASAYWASAVSPDDRASTDNAKALEHEMATPLFADPSVVAAVRILKDGSPKPRKKPAKKATPRKTSPLAAQEAKLRTVRGRLADEFKTLGGNA